jgi:chromosome partitioning protein
MHQNQDGVKTLTILNEKGGVGKTTLACHAAWFFAGAGKRVLVVDVDRQANITSTLSANCQAMAAAQLFISGTNVPANGDQITVCFGTPEVVDVELSRETPPLLAFRDNLRVAAPAFDVCVIDTPPQIGMRTVGALLASDAVIAPVELGDYSLQGVQRLMDAIDGIGETFGRAPSFLGLLVSKFDRRSVRERALFDQLVAEMATILFPMVVTKRDAYARSAAEQIPVWQMAGTASREAANEIRAVMGEIARRMDIALV